MAERSEVGGGQTINTMKKLLLISFLFISAAATAQNVGIGTANPEESALLDLNSTNKGFLLPRLTEKQKSLIPTPAEGLMIYQTDNTQGVYLYQSGNWKNMGSANVTTSTVPGITANITTPNYLLSADANGNPTASSVYVNPSNGYVGIGTSNPDYKLTFVNGSNKGWFDFVAGGVAVGSPGALSLYSNNLERLRIAQNGNIGVGTNAPDYKFTFVSGSNKGYIDFVVGGVAFGSPGSLGLYSNNLERLKIALNGNVGIGLSTPTEKLDVVGSIQQSAVKSSVIKVDANGKFVAAVPGTDYLVPGSTTYIQGSGTANYLTKFSATGTIANSVLAESSNNIGIGTNVPDYKLTLVNGSNKGYIDFVIGGVAFGSPGTMGLYSNNLERLKIALNGNVGIGNGTPTEKLEVSGSIKQSAVTSSILKTDANGKIIAATGGTDYVTAGSNTVGTIAKFTAAGTVANSALTEAAITNGTGIKLDSKSAGYLAVGDFGAGTPMSIPSGYRLVVQDGIITEKVKVAVRNLTDWADYVFEPTYSLMPLNDVEKFVKENKHLPNVPSADEMVEKGVEVGQTSKMFMEKIEELTLYMIELKKEIEALKAENTRLKK